MALWRGTAAMLTLAVACCLANAVQAASAGNREDEANDGGSGAFGQVNTVTPNRGLPQANFGERLFKETRFAQYFFAHSNGNVNAELDPADPTVAVTQMADGTSVPGPFAGQSMNCRSCHLIAELEVFPTRPRRVYGDYARRSPIPAREDGLTVTTRNTPYLGNATFTDPKSLLLHFDGEFATIADLVKATLTGRNYGWLASEQATAIHHIAQVIREDNGAGALAMSTGGPYANALLGGSNVPADFRIPKEFTIDVSRASDAQIVDAVAKLIAFYVRGIMFSQDSDGLFNGSSYDFFLLKNNLPRRPKNSRESSVAYGRRLLAALEALDAPCYVTPANGHFQTHPHTFQFGPVELQGLKIFLSEPGSAPVSSVGNCIACHAPPKFTDFQFHNTGVSQDEYDSIHGAGTFMKLKIPNLASRNANFDAFLPPSGTHPNAAGVFRSIPTASDPSRVDLGVWNMLANPDHPDCQKHLLLALKGSQKHTTKLSALLDSSIGSFKTPGLRDLSDSGPYFHNGLKDTKEDVIAFYIQVAAMSRDGTLRNPDPELLKIQLTPDDIPPLNAFLLALDEDYPD
jgi:hypothetical protein